MVICFLKRKQANEFSVRVDYYKIQKTNAIDIHSHRHTEQKTDRITNFSVDGMGFVSLCPSSTQKERRTFWGMFVMLIVVAVHTSFLLYFLRCALLIIMVIGKLGSLCDGFLLRYGVYIYMYMCVYVLFSL